MQTFFPPGDTTWKKSRTKSHWREFDFMFNQVKRAIEPALSLYVVIDRWRDLRLSHKLTGII